MKIEKGMFDPRVLTLEDVGLYHLIVQEAYASLDGICRLTDGQIAASFQDSHEDRDPEAFRLIINRKVRRLASKGVLEIAEPSRRRIGGRPTCKGLRPLITMAESLRRLRPSTKENPWNLTKGQVLGNKED